MTRAPMAIEDEVRSGMAGYWDRFVGPGQSRAAKAVTVTVVLAAAVRGDRGLSAKASTTSGIVLRLLAADLWGGAWVNNTRSCVRWYERPGQGVAQHLSFAALHLAHPAVIAGVDHGDGSRSRSSAARWAVSHFVWMIGSAALITTSPRRSRLPLAVVASVAGTALDRGLGSSAAAPWFAPVYYTKLLVGHAAGSAWNAGRRAIS